MKRMLTLDGGGERGLIQLRFLAALEARSGKPCSQLFDFIAGTSTGGIAALGLTKPLTSNSKQPAYKAADLVGIYQNRGAEIFSRTGLYEFESAGGINKPKYPPTGIENVLKEYFGDAKISDALIPVLVTSYDTFKPGPRSFTSWDDTILMRDAARATSAAPTYFDPLEFSESKYIDGGVAANNPSSEALDQGEANLFGEDTDVLVVSIGTGNTETREDTTGWGLAQWARYLVTVFMDANSDMVDRHMQKRVGKYIDRYYRFQTALTGVNTAMDDTSPATIQGLLGLADKLVEVSSPVLDKLVALLTT